MICHNTLKDIKNICDCESHWLQRDSFAPTAIDIYKKYIENFSTMCILDVGCAQGRDVSVLLSQGLSTIGLDNNLDYLEEGQKKYPYALFVGGDIECAPFQNNSFDAILCRNVIFNTNPEISLPELERVLKGGGIGIVSLDEKILRIDKNSIIHSADLEYMLSFLAHSEIVERHYDERMDEEPWQHKHYFFDIVFQKHT
jgi:SAM-dependent methyltransferase